MPELPILYSFRRCPYAMRARMALYVNDIAVQLREVELKNKPKEMIDVSPKATVPVLVVNDSQVIDESLDIIRWALKLRDKQGWIENFTTDQKNHMDSLIEENDSNFKQHLDHYKYADRFPDNSADYYRKQGEVFLKKLELQLSQSGFLFGENISIADIAIFPFIRQFAYVDIGWFKQSEYSHLIQWLQYFIDSPDFIAVMKKNPVWAKGEPVVIFKRESS